MSQQPIVPDIPDRHGQNVYRDDPALLNLLSIYFKPELRQHLEPYLDKLGADVGGKLDDLALVADKNPPTLTDRTRTGLRVQSINKHPAYVELEKVAFSELGLAAMAYRDGVLGWPEKMPPIVKYTLTSLLVQAEFGLCCPLSMTDSLTGTLLLHGDDELIERYLPNLTTLEFEDLTQGAMFMTEQGAGSDVSGTTTRAYQEEGEWKLSGDKWFCSNPDAGLAMVLARPDDAPAGLKGLGLFLLPKYLPDGTHNQYEIIRLKDKMGTRSMASGEIELQGATAYLLGEIGRGFQQMADMINMSRLSNGVRSSGLMRRAMGEALYISRNRFAFGKALIDMPLMQRQLIKMLIPSEQSRSMFMQTARCMEQANGGDARAKKLVRIMTPMIKFRACRDARKVTADAMEVRGGCGFIEEWSDPRIVRDSHLGSIWEGTSNIVALDVMRSIKRNGTLEALQDYLEELVNEPNIPKASADLLKATLTSVIGLVTETRNADTDLEVRRAATALYNISTAIFMAWESSQTTDKRRLGMAHALLKQRILPIDPLAYKANEKADAIVKKLLDEAVLTEADALVLLPV